MRKSNIYRTVSDHKEQGCQQWNFILGNTELKIKIKKEELDSEKGSVGHLVYNVLEGVYRESEHFIVTERLIRVTEENLMS